MHRIVNAEEPRVGFRVLYLSALVAWFLLTLIGIGYVVRDSFAPVEGSFRRYAEAATAELRDTLKANEAVLAGFGSFLSAVAANDGPGVRRYSALVLAAYSHIYTLGVVREVNRQDREKFELHFRANGDNQFSIRTFSYDGTRNWSIAPAKPLYQPIVFVWPEFWNVTPVVGVDMDSVPHLREPLLEARARQVAISSRPFKLIQGDLAYVMFRHVDRGELRAWRRREYVFEGPLTALLVMRAAALLPALPAPMTAHRLQITRNGEAIEPAL
jgi:CHASE1-domain containing sensor protein